MTLEIRQLVKDVAYPYYDKRVRHGDRAMRCLPLGTRIVVRRQDEQVGDATVEIVTFRLVNQYLYFTPRKFVLDVLAASVPVEAETVKEYLLLRGGSQYTANQILARLFQNPAARPLIEAALQAELETENDTEEPDRTNQW